ncbi:hypothetical protein N7466_003707 [Penicillium verhagenii]|uniref:uncharacterized protein n=1 Tax=Penicillium verhagenii TaxID=1562060 RepID=UPI0025458C53|nr:uncharacterized protein N7466_003707 [Penicillium verhagenii]KAJ5934160.1 hypothetical protein N7466_003707 [Penicillium verhagenii]
MDQPADTTRETSGHIPMVLDNSGRAPLQVPGFGEVPIDYEIQCDARFAHGMNEWCQRPAVTARELAMTATMNNITDQPGWHVDVFNDQVVAQWRKEAVETSSLLSDKAWSWCLKELRDKAVYLRENQHIRVLEAGSCVCKSDTTTSHSLSTLFRSTTAPLIEQQQQEQENGDRQSDQVVTLVDPSLFPLVYGRTLVLSHGGQVDLQDVLRSYKDTTIAPQHFDKRQDSAELEERDINKYGHIPGRGISPIHSCSEVYRWSSNYQCLPCEVEFLKDSGTEVQITSYINNLHPDHRKLYNAIEKLISMAIKPWNECLVQGRHGWDDENNLGQMGPVPLRIITFGIEWKNELLEWAIAFNVPAQSSKQLYHKVQEQLQSNRNDQTEEGRKRYLKAKKRLSTSHILRAVEGRDNMQLPPPDSDLWQKAKKYLELPERDSTGPVKVPDDWAEGGEGAPWIALEGKMKRALHFKHPEPGTAFTYEDWKTGQHKDKAIIDLFRGQEGLDPCYAHVKPKVQPHTPYTITLQDTFRKHGLQIIVKMDNIELTPETPAYPGDDWHLEYQLNEHVVAAAVFAYDVKNITEPRISFRQYTLLHGIHYQYDDRTRFHRAGGKWENPPAKLYGKSYDATYEAISEILGFQGLDLSLDNFGFPPFQNTGSIATPQGRLITFPNLLEHRVEPFKLADPSCPGHYRSIKLYLVDPHYRICSTRNVPPQQHHWWAQEVEKSLAMSGLPCELSDEIFQETGYWPMGIEEARQHRREFMRELRWNATTRLSSMGGPGF